jgi:hypothetical protein
VDRAASCSEVSTSNASTDVSAVVVGLKEELDDAEKEVGRRMEEVDCLSDRIEQLLECLGKA